MLYGGNWSRISFLKMLTLYVVSASSRNWVKSSPTSQAALTNREPSSMNRWMLNSRSVSATFKLPQTRLHENIKRLAYSNKISWGREHQVMHNCKNVKKKPTKSKDLSQFKGRVCKKVDLFIFFSVSFLIHRMLMLLDCSPTQKLGIRLRNQLSHKLDL